MSAFRFLAAKRRDLENHRELGLASLAQCGDPKAIQSQLDEWEKDA